MATELLRSSSWRHGRHRERGRRTATATTRARSSTARWPTGSCPWRSTGTRVALATRAETLGDLQSLGVGPADRQRAGATARRSSCARPAAAGAGSGWGMRAAVAGVLVVLGIAIGWGLYGNTTSPLSFTSDPGAKSDGITPVVLTPPKQLHSLGGLTGLHRADAAEVRRHHGLPADRLSRLRVAGSARSPGRPASAEYTYRGGWGDPYDERRRATTTAWSTWASSTSRPSSACCAERPRRSASSRRTSRAPT